VADWRAQRCPFLTVALGRDHRCIKSENSLGVCTISAASNGPRQDWLVCPYRALDDELLDRMVRRLFGIEAEAPVIVAPVVKLLDPVFRAEVLGSLRASGKLRIFVYFQDKLGGEIALPKTTASPELSFDITVVELLPAVVPALPSEASAPMAEQVRVGKYGIIELQTTDTHGRSYSAWVNAVVVTLDRTTGCRALTELTFGSWRDDHAGYVRAAA